MGLYVSLAEVRANVSEITDPPYTDAIVQNLIILAQRTIDEITGQFFTEREFIVTFDGNDSDTLLLPIPLSPKSDSLVSLTINDNLSVTINDTNIQIFRDANLIRDDRRNPKLVLENNTFLHKYKQIVNGKWGFLEQTIDPSSGDLLNDYNTPVEIKQCMYLLLAANAAGKWGVKPSSSSSTLVQSFTPLTRQEVDGFSIEFGRIERNAGSPKDKTAFTGIAPVDRILKNYLAPIGIQSTANNFKSQEKSFFPKSY